MAMIEPSALRCSLEMITKQNTIAVDIFLRTVLANCKVCARSLCTPVVDVRTVTKPFAAKFESVLGIQVMIQFQQHIILAIIQWVCFSAIGAVATNARVISYLVTTAC